MVQQGALFMVCLIMKSHCWARLASILRLSFRIFGQDMRSSSTGQLRTGMHRKKSSHLATVLRAMLPMNRPGHVTQCFHSFDASTPCCLL